MPLYEYRCRNCGKEHEILQKFSDPPLRRCPSCRGRVDKLVSRTSFQLKGGGWYNEGYSSSGKSGGGSSGGDKSKSKGSGKKDGGGKKAAS